jgi:MYXO-CTERM domain-containing protein
MPTQTSIIALAAAAAAAALLWRRRRRRVPPPGPQQPPLALDARMLDRVLSTIEEEILPQTKTQLAKGNKMFGAAVLDAFSGDTVVAATNLETACPIHHGEVVAIEAWSSLKKRPRASECLFVATHEPCCLCVSAIVLSRADIQFLGLRDGVEAPRHRRDIDPTQVWSGFERCVFLFPYETTKRQGIPHDLDIMYELWRVERYQRRNRYLATSGVSTLIAALPPSSERADLEERVARLAAAYDALADSYKKGPRPDVAFA